MQDAKYQVTLKDPFLQYGNPHNDPGSAIKSGHRLGMPFYVFEHFVDGETNKVYDSDDNAGF